VQNKLRVILYSSKYQKMAIASLQSQAIIFVVYKKVIQKMEFKNTM